MLLLAEAAVAQQGPRVAADAPSSELPQRVDGTLLQIASGYVFPKSLGRFPLTKKWIIAADDVMVDYGERDDGNSEPWLSLYVFRRPFGVDREVADEIEGPLIEAWRATPLAQQPAIPKLPADARARWFSGTRNGNTVTTGYVVVKRAGWFIEVRATAPSAAGKAWLRKMYDAVGRIDWDHVNAAIVRNLGPELRRPPVAIGA